MIREACFFPYVCIRKCMLTGGRTSQKRIAREFKIHTSVFYNDIDSYKDKPDDGLHGYFFKNVPKSIQLNQNVQTDIEHM